MEWYNGDGHGGIVPRYVSNRHRLLPDLVQVAVEASTLTYLGYKIAKYQIKAGARADLIPAHAYNVAHVANAYGRVVGSLYYISLLTWLVQTVNLLGPHQPYTMRNWVMGTVLVFGLSYPLHARVIKGARQWAMTPLRTEADLMTPWWLVGRMLLHLAVLVAMIVLFAIYVGGSAG